MVKPILLLGDPGLRKISEIVKDFSNPEISATCRELDSALNNFRARYGFGHGIAAPQIGFRQRMIALNLGAGPIHMINPEITWRNQEQFSLWDSCMSFPFLVIRISRARSISVTFQDATGAVREWNRLNPAVSALIQHEIDHLNGILAIDHALDRDAVLSREVFFANQAYFLRQVDPIDLSIGFGYQQP